LTAHVGASDAAFGLTELLHPAGRIWLAGAAGPQGAKARIIVKATDVTLSKARPNQMSVQGMLAGHVETIAAEGPFALVCIALEGEGRLYAMATRRAVADLGLGQGEAIFALIKTVALDERMVGQAALAPSLESAMETIERCASSC
jgi:molybdate transport system ATP-binding protein